MSEKNTAYLEQRLSELGISSPEQYTIRNQVYGNFKRGDEGFQDQSFEIFQADDEGNIRIYYPTLDGLKIQWRSKDSKHTKAFYITRLLKPKGDMKYAIPKGAGTHPFFPPNLISKFQRKAEIKTLFLTEGAFKAFKGDMHGIDIVGLTSITHAKDRDTQGLHPDIISILKVCNVQRVVWLVDGDCNRLSSKPIEEIEDLYRRPNQFFNSARTFRQFLEQFEIEKWFVHPMTDQLADIGSPKGLDDLLVAEKGNEESVVADLLNFSKKGNFHYFHKIDIRYGEKNLRNYFHLSSVDDFVHHHSEMRPELKKAQFFVYNGTKYAWNEEKGHAIIVTPAEVKNYFRAGDDYYEKLLLPNKYGQLEKVFHRRKKSTIMDDYDKGFCKLIPKYKGFCNLPDHKNYQEVIHGFYNVYGPFEHEPEPGEFETTMDFLKHIFGTGEISYDHPTQGKIKIKELDLGLDYIQLLYQHPTQTLPILCLVSRENGTGKSTLGKWLKMIFTLNAVVVGNADLANDFNASWSTKLLVICDEAKIDKQVVVEKVKALSTADKILMNAKGRDQQEIDFFAKFIFNSNNEDNFIYASEDDVRYWVRKIPRITKPDVFMLQKMQDEIPAFLEFLNTRKIVTPNVHRAWFDPELIKTDALQKVIQNSRPTIEKEIRARIREMFLEHDVKEILMAAKDINEEFFNKKYEMNYMHKTLKDEMKVPMYQEGDTVRYVFPRMERKVQEGHIQQVAVEVKCIGRPYHFKIERFLLPDEIEKRRFKLDVVSSPGAIQSDLPF